MSSNEAGRSEQPAWRTASYCASGECVQITQRDGLIILRDSTRPGGITLPYAAVKWQSFVADTKAGKFDNLGF
jgi:hypothetical protein